jgi:cell division septal protein FtsQ
VDWGPLLWVLLVANVASGLYFSPITAVRKVRIVGADESQRGQLVHALQLLKDRSALGLDPREFESVVLKNGAVRNADFRRSLFGSASLRIENRKAVAAVEGSAGAYLDEEGVLFKLKHQNLELPTVKLHSSAVRPAFAAAGSWPARSVARLIQALPANLAQKDLRVEVDSEGAVCLNRGTGARIVLGSADRLEAKLQALQGLIAEKPNLLTTVKELNLTEPSRPAVTPAGGSSR